MKRCAGRKNELNVFLGEKAVLDFLNPEKNVMLPLVEVSRQINPFYDDGVRIYAKLLNMLPLNNVKSLPAFNMLNEFKEQGRLDDVHTIIENSSGNTVLSLAVIGRLMGIENTKAFVSHEVLPGKLDMLRLFGVECLVNEEPICPDPADKTSGIFKSRKMGRKKGWINPGQYENEANPRAHEKWTAKQIYKQLNGDVQVFGAGMGTTGTVVGCSKYFKKMNKNIQTVGVIRSANNPVPGVRTRGLLKMIAFGWQRYVDDLEEVNTVDSFKMSLDLIRQGLVVGPSSGFALAGLLQYLSQKKRENKLDNLRNENGIINSVFICCDSPFSYLEEYFRYLDSSNFPKIVGEEKLLNKRELNSVTDKFSNFSVNKYALGCKDAFQIIYGGNVVEKKTRKNLSLLENIVVLDVRNQNEFDHYHLWGSKRVDYREVLFDNKKIVENLRNKKVVVACNFGEKSAVAVNVFRNVGVDAVSLDGGLTEWSRLDLPRWRPDVCRRLTSE